LAYFIHFIPRFHWVFKGQLVWKTLLKTGFTELLFPFLGKVLPLFSG